jgi:hypothetical protein
MQIDRSRFLLLTTTIAAAAACTANSTTTDSNAADLSPATCDTLATGDLSTCARYADGGLACLTGSVCSGASTNLKPEIAALVDNCVARQATCDVGPCIKTAAQTPYGQAGGPSAPGYTSECADTAAQTACFDIYWACGDAGSAAGPRDALCRRVVGRLTEAGRSAFVSCMTESACFIPDQLDTCLAELF